MRNYDEIANRVLEKRDEHIKSKRKKIKILTGVCCAVLAVFAGLGLWKNYFSGSQPFDIHGEETTVEPTLTPADPNNPIASGGDEYDWFNAYSDKVYGVTGELITYIENTHNIDFTEWAESFKPILQASKYGESDPEYVPLLVKTIKEFDIPRSVIEQINSEHIASYIEMEQSEDFIKRNTFSSEEIDALYSGDLKEISRVFPAENAIIHNGRAFGPKWYLNASDEELARYGISKETVREKAFYFISNQAGGYLQYKTAQAYFKATIIDDAVYGENIHYPPEQYEEVEMSNAEAAEYFGKDFSKIPFSASDKMEFYDNGTHKIIYSKNGEIVSDWCRFQYNGHYYGGMTLFVEVSKIGAEYDCVYITQDEISKQGFMIDGIETKLYLLPVHAGSLYLYCIAEFEHNGIHYRVEGRSTEFDKFYSVLETIINES
ncbi:MAG: hypothetical protein IKK09_02895 [Clostridia bacterium]|nr:hypothetical protein [Clostridia bacterium]